MTTNQLKTLLKSVMIQQVFGDNLWWGPGVAEQTRIIEDVFANPDAVIGSVYVVTLGALARAVRAAENDSSLDNYDSDGKPTPQ